MIQSHSAPKLRLHRPLRFDPASNLVVDRTFWTVTHGGLCDRLTVIGVTSSWAKASARTFRFSWINNRHCGCSWDDLFYPFAGIVNFAPQSYDYNLNILPYEKRPSLELIKRQLCGPQASLVVLCSPVGTFAERTNDFDKHFRLKPHIAMRVEEMRQQIGERCIGVHIRRGDFTTYSPPLPAIEQYLEAVRSMESKHQLGERIFLSTDDGAPSPASVPTRPIGVEEKFRRIFGDRLVVVPKQSLERNRKSTIADAAVDLWTLRSCAAVIGTRKSGFSMVGAAGRPNMFL